MKPIEIKDVLDLSLKANQNGFRFIPLFVGPPGIGKSAIIQQWVKEKQLQLVDVRGAYLEAPDVVGKPKETVKDGREVLSYILPEFWPTSGKGLLLLDEINRSPNSVMNAYMQLLTDYKVHSYSFPNEWLIAAAINPEDEFHDVNHMDSALLNRFSVFHIDFDKDSFVEYMKSASWDKDIITFIDSGLWKYAPPQEISTSPGAIYISGRNWEKLNAAKSVGIPRSLESSIYESNLGPNYGKAFYNFVHNERPILLKDLLTNLQLSLDKLKEYSDPNNYKNSHLSITCKDLIDNESQVSMELLTAVVLVIPADQAVSLVSQLELKRKDTTIFANLIKNKEVHSRLKKTLKDNNGK